MARNRKHRNKDRRARRKARREMSYALQERLLDTLHKIDKRIMSRRMQTSEGMDALVKSLENKNYIYNAGFNFYQRGSSGDPKKGPGGCK